jgi:hypothetical protein
MRSIKLAFFVTSAVAAMLAAAACGDDDDNVVRNRDDAGGVDSSIIADAAADTAPQSSCGIALPTTYVSPGYDSNAVIELTLRTQFDAFLKPMKDAETAFGNVADGGAPPAAITKAQLEPLYTAGTPSIKSISTAFYQGKVDTYLTEYEAAFADNAYAPVDPPVAADKGGLYGKFIFNSRGLDLRQVMEKGTFTAGFYNHAVGVLAAGPITEATIDRLVAAFGAHPTFPGDPAAAQNKDVNSASYAARRSKDPNITGPYQKIKQALIKAKASVAAGAKCDKDRDESIKLFFAEWERSNYATVIFYFNDIIKKLGGAESSGNMHSYGEVIGFLSGFRTIAQDKRIITDAQIDQLLTTALAPTAGPVEAYKVHTSSGAAGAALQQVISDIKTIYAFTDAEIAAFKNFN